MAVSLVVHAPLIRLRGYDTGSLRSILLRIISYMSLLID